jgi:hypothetical protein
MGTDTGRPMSRSVAPAELGAQRPRFTVYLDFVAADVGAARAFAAGLAEGLGALCADVDALSALLSPVGLAGCGEPVFCGVAGPDGRVCADLYGHAGLHGNATGRLRVRCSPGPVDGSVAVPVAEVGMAAVSGYRLGGVGRRADLPYVDYER